MSGCCCSNNLIDEIRLLKTITSLNYMSCRQMTNHGCAILLKGMEVIEQTIITIRGTPFAFNEIDIIF